MPAQAHEVLFEEDQSFCQTWVWPLMVGVLVLLIAVLGIFLSQAPHQASVPQGVPTLGFVLVTEIAAPGRVRSLGSAPTGPSLSTAAGASATA